MKIKIQIKSVLGKVLFELEKEKNNIEKTLNEAIKRNANLGGANLVNANLGGANLVNANLRGANLVNANLVNANLVNANLVNANLGGANNYYCFIAYDTSKRIVHCIKHDGTWMIKAGCFWGTLEELEIKVKESHNSKVYLNNIEILKNL